MLSKEAIEELKNEGYTFEQINELSKRIESIDNGTAVFLEEDEFWERVISKINTKMKEHV